MCCICVVLFVCAHMCVVYVLVSVDVYRFLCTCVHMCMEKLKLKVWPLYLFETGFSLSEAEAH